MIRSLLPQAMAIKHRTIHRDIVVNALPFALPVSRVMQPRLAPHQAVMPHEGSWVLYLTVGAGAH
ncbi:hypothetical protein [Photobacterium sp. OFAV2-7]|uniref:hypothetical protein n=1 Tax=Photobacterium sp. OFAV2-7 TaxID=2917748 RepID=UPI001EF65689|nr:hypothetical protein [Photobacterium sp. OFAV2-7]MCG7588371.1 hypothetical protein [Photobacterium sp. OFAV2-7]